MSVANCIPARIAEALRKFPPFSMVPAGTVAALAAKARVRVLVNGEQVWQQGDSPGDEVLFLAQGRVEYHREVDGNLELVDVRDVGDVLGLSALHEGESFRVTAEVKEDSILYVLSWPDVRDMLEHNDQARNYVRRHLFWGTRVGRTVPNASFNAGDARSILEAHLDGAQIIQPRANIQLLCCLPGTSIRSAAEQMVERNLPSILVVDEAQRPKGFVTNDELVKKVLVETTSPEAPVASIMVFPIVTVAPQTSSMAALLAMLHEQIDYICITEDGTPDSRVLDICTPKDLLAQSGHHPVGIATAIRRARSPARFRELCDDIEAVSLSYLEAGISGIVMGQICAQLFGDLVTRMIQIATSTTAASDGFLPDVPWAWVAVGSDGRREQILRTDMDNAFIFESSGNEATDELHRAAFLKLNQMVVDMMVDAGFTRCQGGVMAANPRWCRTDREWLAELQDGDLTLGGDGMLRALILYDLRYVAGDKALCARIRDTIFEVASLAGSVRRLAEKVVSTPPPLNFRGKFVIEKKGTNEGEFDIKTRGLTPIRDAARVFAFHYGLKSHHSTGGRLMELASAQPKLEELARLARDGYDLLLRFRTLTGLRRNDDGRYIDPSALTKLEREQLANIFDVQRMLQSAVRNQFNLEVSR